MRLSTKSTLAFIGLICASLFNSVWAAVTPQIVASRVAGVAPLAVFVDATTTAGLDGGDYINANFDWNFDRDNVDPTGKHSVTRGFVAAHVYETPETYTIQLIVHDRLGATATSTTQIVVSPFAGTTYYVAICGSNSAAGTAMTAPLATPDYAISNKGGPNTRILLRCGDRFPFPPTNVSATGPMIVGSYSHPNNPSSVPPMLYCSTDGWGILNVSGADCRIMDIHIRSAFTSIDNGNVSPNQRAGSVGMTASNTLFLRVEVDSVGRDAIEGNGRNTFFFDCYYHDYGGYGCYVDSLNHFALVGVVSRRLKGGQHFVRSQGGSKAFIAYNDLDQSNANDENITCRGSTTQAYVLGNRLDQNMSFHPQYDGAVEYQSYCVADGNLFRGGSIGVAAKHVSIRNNLFNNGSVGLSTFQVVGISDDVTICNNSFYGYVNEMVNGSATNVVIKNNILYASQADEWAKGLAFGNSLANYRIDNNIYYAPNKNGYLWFSNGGVDYGRTAGFIGWQATGNDTHGMYANPLFVSTDSSSPDFLKLSASSPARGAGAVVPVFDDVAGTPRPAGQPTDAGAWLYGSNAGVRPFAKAVDRSQTRVSSGDAMRFDLLGRLVLQSGASGLMKGVAVQR
jgi:hypothetical protein